MYSAEGASACTHCGVGYFCPLEATTEEQKLLNLCPMGTYCRREVSVMQSGNLVTIAVGLDVYPNKDSVANGGHGCPLYKYCPRGTGRFEATNPADVPLDIPRGTMQEVFSRGDLSDAIKMPAGWYSEAISNTDPRYADQKYETLPCPVGYYCPDGSYETIACPAGYYRDTEYGKDVTDCGPCPAGTYCPTVGFHTPTPCGLGNFCPEGSAVQQKCPRGTYNDVQGAYDSRGCKACTAGYYCPFLGQEAVDTVNHQCDAGFVCIQGASRPEPTDQTTGQQCPLLGYCPKGTATTQSCPAGTIGKYVGAQDSFECIDCEPGFYCKGDGTSTPCKEGYWCELGTIDPTDPVDATACRAGVTLPCRGQPAAGQYTNIVTGYSDATIVGGSDWATLRT